jgi:hypothetical protein
MLDGLLDGFSTHTRPILRGVAGRGRLQQQVFPLTLRAPSTTKRQARPAPTPFGLEISFLGN